MIEWITPVYDRTEEDVQFARRMIAEWIFTGSTQTYPLKGCLNLVDLNRIENNIQYLGEILTAYRYASGISVKTWTGDGLPNIADIQRILRNVSKLARALPLREDVPEPPNDMKKYNEINDIEKILLEVKAVVEELQGCFQLSDTFYSGARNILPLRR